MPGQPFALRYTDKEYAWIRSLLPMALWIRCLQREWRRYVIIVRIKNHMRHENQLQDIYTSRKDTLKLFYNIFLEKKFLIESFVWYESL